VAALVAHETARLDIWIPEGAGGFVDIAQSGVAALA
jgi:hypothetical protein